MPETIFDLIDEPISDGKEGYFELAKRAPQPKDNSFFGSVADYGKTFLKGGIEGISRLGRMMGPLQDESGKTSEQMFQEQTESLNRLLPTEEGFGQRAVRRGLKETPTMLAFPGGSATQTVARTGLAGFAGEGAKEIGAPDWLQTAAELTAFMGPDITKKLIESGSNKEIIESARKLGISDEALTPLLQSDFKQKWLSKFTPRRGSTESTLGKSKSELGKIYQTIQKSEEATLPLSPESTKDLMKDFSEKLFKMPSAVRNKVKEDFRDLISAPLTGETLMNFYADINHYLGENAKQLSLLKEPIKKALKSVSPQLEEDFTLINDLYSKYNKISSKLKPNLKTDISEAILGASEALSILSSVLFGYYPALVTFAGEKAGRKIAQQMLTNPRLQQISTKIVKALNENKFGMAKKLVDLFGENVRKISPEFSNKLEDISLEDFEKISRPEEQK